MDKFNHLKQILKNHEGVAVAFSGGVDSTFLLKVAHDVLGDRAIAITADSPNFAPDEIKDAKEFCQREGIRHIVLKLGNDVLDRFADNPKDRCYICKKAVFGALLTAIGDESGSFCLADGTNADDANDYRPGTKAIEELHVISPLKEAGLTKSEIRGALKDLGLPVWSKPAFACLASRIPYGERITIEKLNAIYTVEKALRDRDFDQVRVRHHGAVARIEVLPEDRVKFFDTELMDEINEIAMKAGFTYASLDLTGYKMGSLNVF